MRDRDLYAQILGLSEPWRVTEVTVDNDKEEVVVHVKAHGHGLPCPRCQEPCRRYDHRVRRWRHLDTCQYRTFLEAEVPRVECPEHGIHQVVVPWAEPGSRFTALYEALAIDWLLEANVSAVARRLRLSWDEVDAIQQRAVLRGLARREDVNVKRIGVDETSFRKGHKYVTVVTDAERSRVLHVADDRKQESLEEFFDQLSNEQLDAIQVVSMDMWKPYMQATLNEVPDAESKIAFDKFHVAQHLGEAVDRVRRQEHRALLADGDETLKGSKYVWLTNPGNMRRKMRASLNVLRELALKTARAWALKETAMSLWDYVSVGWARRAWKGWLSWAMRSRLEPMKKVARMIRTHLWGILNAIILQATNAAGESMNAKIQRVKRLACGFRNRERFRTAIYFHLGGLDLYPSGASFTHTKP